VERGRIVRDTVTVVLANLASFGAGLLLRCVVPELLK
jgi:hypothetical protein